MIRGAPISFLGTFRVSVWVVVKKEIAVIFPVLKIYCSVALLYRYLEETS